MEYRGRSGILLGVKLVNGLGVIQKCGRLGALLGALLTLLNKMTASPEGMERYRGTLQWTCLLNRPILSTFSRVYEFADRSSYSQLQQVPREVLDELVYVWQQGMDPRAS